MRNRSAIWVFTILLTLACLYQLSFSWVTMGIENDALSYGKANADQIINVQDIVLIINWILLEEYSSCGDVNCDQILNEDDVAIIENSILGLGDISGCVNCIDDVIIVVETCGCLDPLACNYCPSCTMDDDSCWYLDDCSEIAVEEFTAPIIVYNTYDLLGQTSTSHKIHLEVYSNGVVKTKCIIR